MDWTSRISYFHTGQYCYYYLAPPNSILYAAYAVGLPKGGALWAYMCVKKSHENEQRVIFKECEEIILPHFITF